MTASVETIQDTLNRVELLCQDIAGNLVIKPTQIIIYEGLSDISENLGLAVAGEFRTGVGTPGRGFSGMRIAYPGMLYGTDTWHLVGVNNDVLQAGISATTGKFYAGAGAVTLDSGGIDIKWADTPDYARALTFTEAISSEVGGFLGGQTDPASGIYGAINTLVMRVPWVNSREGHISITADGAKDADIFLSTIEHTSNTSAYIYMYSDDVIGENAIDLVATFIDLSAAVTINHNTAWHAGNDGHGSGLDADTLDGHQPGTGNGLDADLLDGHQPGSGNGLDADMLDGSHLPVWTAWNPTFTGFTGGSEPAGGVYTYTLLGKVCTINVRQPNTGVSNNAVFTISLPFTAASGTNYAWWNAAFVVDNGITQTTPGVARVLTGATAVEVFKDYAANGFTNSGNKRTNFQLSYQIA